MAIIIKDKTLKAATTIAKNVLDLFFKFKNNKTLGNVNHKTIEKAAHKLAYSLVSGVYADGILTKILKIE